jgi:hypothetical protein
MRSQVQPFPVDVHDIYENARASMTSRPHRSSSIVWGLTALAVLVGAGLGWYLAAWSASAAAVQRLAAPAAIERTTPDTNAGEARTEVRLVADGLTETAIETATGWLRRDRLGTAPAQPLGADAWPIVLHRAGDGQFYADLSLDGHIVNGRIDPEQPRTTLRSSDLPAEAVRGVPGWQVDEVVLEHLRLPATRFAVSDDPAAESVIGADLLGRFFTIEERFDRLRLVPRAG